MKRGIVAVLGALAAVVAALTLISLFSGELKFRGQTIHYWVDHLKSPIGLTAREVFKEAGAAAVPGLLKVIHSKEDLLRRSLRSNYDVLPRFVTAKVRRPDSHIQLRYSAFEALQMIGSNAPAASPDLIKLLANDPDSAIRSAAAKTLQTIIPASGESVAALKKGIGDVDAAVRAICRSALAAVLPEDELENFYRATIVRGDLLSQLSAADWVMKKGQRSEHAALTPIFVAAAGHTNSFIRLEAVECINRLRVRDPAILPVLIELLADPGIEIKRQTMACLRRFGFRARPAVGALLECLNHKNRSVRLDALSVLQVAGVASPEMVSALRRFLTQPNDTSSMIAASILSQIGPGAGDALPELLELLSTAPPAFRRHLLMRNGRYDFLNEAEDQWARSGSNDDLRWLVQSIDMLWRMGPSASTVRPKLDGFLASTNEMISRAAAKAICQIAPQDCNEAAERLKQEFEIAEGIEKISIAGALLQTDAATPPMIEFLRDRIKHGSSQERIPSAWHLFRADPTDEASLAVLVNAIHNNDVGVISLLPKLGKQSRAAIPALKEALNSEFPPVAIAAVNALREIEPSVLDEF